MKQRLRILLNRDLCIGSENCVRGAPNTFDTRDGAVVLLDGPHDDDDAVRAAVAACPVGALALVSERDEGSK